MEAMPARTAYATDCCLWCGIRLKVDDMFRVGSDEENRRVCGSDCPARPVIDRPGKTKGDYTVTTTVQVSGRVQNKTHAMNLVKRAAREGYTDKRIIHFEMGVTKNKK